MTAHARIYVASVIAPGFAVLAWAALQWQSASVPGFAVYLAIAVFLGVTRIKLPGLVGTYSLSFLPILYGVNHFTPAEVLAAAAFSAVAGSVVKAKARPDLIQVLFNAANLTLSAGSCLLVYGLLADKTPYLPALLCAMVTVYFSVNTFIVSGILCLVQGKPLSAVCEAWYLWSFVYYLAGAAALGLAMSSSGEIQPWILLLPISYLMWFFWDIRTRRMEEAPAGSNLRIPVAARVFAYGISILGGSLLVAGLAQWSSPDPVRFAACLAVAALASGFKIRLPGIEGTISTGFVMILFAASELQWAETMLIAALAGAVQCLWKTDRRPRADRVIFSVAALILSSAAAYGACRFLEAPLLPRLLATTVVFYGCNTVLICGLLALTERKKFLTLWTACRFWSLPYYLVGTSASGMMVVSSRGSSYAAAFLVLSVMALVFLAYRVHLKDVQLRAPAV